MPDIKLGTTYARFQKGPFDYKRGLSLDTTTESYVEIVLNTNCLAVSVFLMKKNLTAMKAIALTVFAIALLPTMFSVICFLRYGNSCGWLIAIPQFMLAGLVAGIVGTLTMRSSK